MQRNNGGASSSKAGCSAPAKQTRNEKKCLFCRSKVARISKPLQKGYSKYYNHVCEDCAGTERFTMEDLQEMTEADLAALEKCKVLENYEVPADSDGSDVLVGYFEWQQCGICRVILRKGDDVRDHNNDMHDCPVQKCCLGCNQYSAAINALKATKKRCCIWCPKCKVIVNDDHREHFENTWHKDVFRCPADGCCDTFMRKDLNLICDHLLSTHTWRYLVTNRKRKSSPVNKRRRKK
ncbi:Hypothetical predicted protein [Cloeon dipterum]|uniref:Uncharacterized protein n=1 Tax=Cloeon dipterum TaxID=197152 RepID=A0A8S1DK95_9INSE|nr:Hypothetical predicted protein [Cloeon dipterum]